MSPLSFPPLSSLQGEWTGRSQVWFDPTQGPNDDSAMRATVRELPLHKMLEINYSGAFGDKDLEGRFLIAWSGMEREMQVSWIDSFHNGRRIMHCRSERLAEDSGFGFPFEVKGSYPADGEGSCWGWKLRFSLENSPESGFQRLLIEHFNLMPGSEDQPMKAVLMQLDQTHN